MFFIIIRASYPTSLLTQIRMRRIKGFAKKAIYFIVLRGMPAWLPQHAITNEA
ncbi:hypothetical protein [Pararhizobium sp.]|uniref:hypothetical protein n=1 Tax=Pararhizobium sp. TaxID=1977563 RepID=UPI003D0E1761